VIPSETGPLKGGALKISIICYLTDLQCRKWDSLCAVQLQNMIKAAWASYLCDPYTLTSGFCSSNPFRSQ
jgi:hypothetical protein